MEIESTAKIQLRGGRWSIVAGDPDADETSQSQQAKFPTTDVFNYGEVTGGRIWLKPKGVACFAGDLSEQEQKLVYATHYAPAADIFSRNAPGVAWKSKPSWLCVVKTRSANATYTLRTYRVVWEAQSGGLGGR